MSLSNGNSPVPSGTLSLPTEISEDANKFDSQTTTAQNSYLTDSCESGDVRERKIREESQNGTMEKELHFDSNVGGHADSRSSKLSTLEESYDSITSTNTIVTQEKGARSKPDTSKSCSSNQKGRVVASRYQQSKKSGTPNFQIKTGHRTSSNRKYSKMSTPVHSASLLPELTCDVSAITTDIHPKTKRQLLSLMPVKVSKPKEKHIAKESKGSAKGPLKVVHYDVRSSTTELEDAFERYLQANFLKHSVTKGIENGLVLALEEKQRDLEVKEILLKNLEEYYCRTKCLLILRRASETSEQQIKQLQSFSKGPLCSTLCELQAVISGLNNHVFSLHFRGFTGLPDECNRDELLMSVESLMKIVEKCWKRIKQHHKPFQAIAGHLENSISYIQRTDEELKLVVSIERSLHNISRKYISQAVVDTSEESNPIRKNIVINTGTVFEM